jgi:hypothetical protein
MPPGAPPQPALSEAERAFFAGGLKCLRGGITCERWRNVSGAIRRNKFFLNCASLSLCSLCWVLPYFRHPKNKGGPKAAIGKRETGN